ncbi:MAG: aryl-sulfate sulfotransferase [Myxococcota bacterium]
MIAWWWAGCTPEPAADSGATRSDTAIATGHTGAQPTATAWCEPTDNALRFACGVTLIEPGPVEIRVTRVSDGGERRVSSPAAALEHALVLSMLAPGAEYDWTASPPGDPETVFGSGRITAGEPPEGVRSTLAVTGTSSVPYVGANNPCDPAGAVAVIHDTATGELVWYHDFGAGTLGMVNMVRFTPAHTVLAQTGAAVIDVDLAGTELARFTDGVEYDLTLHHDLFARGGLYYLLFQESGSPVLDGFVVLDPAGAELARWRAEEHLIVPADAFGDWMHTNTLWVDPDLQVTLSLHEQASVIRVDGDPDSPTFGELSWIVVGDPPAGLLSDLVIDWSGVDGADLFLDQHDAHPLPDGRLVLLDNPHGRALVLSLDPEGGVATADEAWEAEGTGFCGPQGTAEEAAPGHLFAACSGLSVREWDRAAAEVVWTGSVVCETPVGLGSGVARFYPLDGW